MQQSNTIDRIENHRAKSDTIFQHRTLPRNVRHCQTRSSSNLFDAVSLYHTVSRAGKRYFSASYESVLILTILHHLVLEGVKFRMLVAGHGLQVIIESWLHFLAASFVDFSRGKLLPVKLWCVCLLY